MGESHAKTVGRPALLNNAFRMLTGLSRMCSASGMFAEARVGRLLLHHHAQAVHILDVQGAGQLYNSILTSDHVREQARSPEHEPLFDGTYMY